jgi:hypothetical protein
MSGMKPQCREGDPGAIGRPRWIGVVSLGSQLNLIGTVRAHHVDLGVERLLAVAVEGDLAAV